MHRLRQTLLLSALVLIAWAARPAQVYGRAAGGCLERGTAVLTPRGSVPVEELKPGDKVLSAVGPSLVEAEVKSTACGATAVSCPLLPEEVNSSSAAGVGSTNQP